MSAALIRVDVDWEYLIRFYSKGFGVCCGAKLESTVNGRDVAAMQTNLITAQHAAYSPPVTPRKAIKQGNEIGNSLG